ncbi:VPLPA-CTERM sorting domain-containing protein [Frigidibacter sp. MR17.24]|uniref:VPLPA-CTERM sorting domain-containing protein n=1 Tax=Frigidibacter sp. MR17.24 TaxID=3127345 RepID=UPI0030130E8E
MSFLKTICVLALCAIAPLPAAAATLDLAALGYTAGPITHAGGVELDLFDGGGYTTAYLFAADFPFGVSGVSVTDLADPTGAAAFGLVDPLTPGANLAGNGATAFGVADGLFEWLFEGIVGTGPFAALNGGAALVRLMSTEITEAAGLSGVIYDQTAQLVITSLVPIPNASVPLPATGLLLIGGVAGLGLLRRRRG